MNKWLAAAAVMVVSASLAFAMPQEGKGWGGHRGHRSAMSEKFAQKLNLTDTQKQQVRDLDKQFRQDNKAFFESARQTRQEYKAAKESNDTAKLNSLKPAVESQKAQMKQLRDAQDAKILTILTPDQQTQFKALQTERAAKWQSKRSQQ
ncbi:MAG: Spy/CpxP family protein refolding chaperone [Acidobacteriota bacterium]|nr:Spy/CpxP family protein refolding chaperone [Acidobacteriota bacterium]